MYRWPDRITDTPCRTGAAVHPRTERTGLSRVVNTHPCPRGAKAVTASAAAAERPRPMATLRAPGLSESSVIRLNSAPAGPDPAVSQARPDGSRGDNVIFPLLPETYLVAGPAGLR